MIDPVHYSADPKAYMELYEENKTDAEYYRHVLEDIADAQTAIKIDGLPSKGNITHPTEEAAIRLAEKKSKLQPRLEAAEQICDDVLDTIDAVKDIDTRSAELLRWRYVNGAKWKEIASNLYYSVPYVKRELHKIALERVWEVMKRKEREYEQIRRDFTGREIDQV